MKSLNQFIVTPYDNRYNNKIKVGNKELILNSKIDTFQSVSKKAIVVSTPININTPIQVNDEVLIHHNIFRRYYDMKGKEKNSARYFKNDLFFCDMYQIYLYKKKEEWYTHLDYCFVIPTNNPLEGIIKYTNKELEKQGIIKNDLITFSPDSEFEFMLNGELLYCMRSKNIILKHEYQENQIKYNPSWAQSS